MNKSFLIGRLTKDPELKVTATGRSVCQFTIAVNRPYTNEDGERKADFLNCVVWDKQAENLNMYQKKGNQIAVEGRIQTRNYEDNNGKKVYVTEIIVINISYLDTKKDDSNFNNLEEPPVQSTDSSIEENDNQNTVETYFNQQQIEIDDNDLPF